MTIIFFDICSYPPPIAVWNSLTNQFYLKIHLSVYFQQQNKKITSLNRDIHPGDSWPYDVRPGLYLYINWTRKLYLSIFMAWDLYLATVQPRQLYLNIVQHLKNCTYCMSRPRELNQVPFRYLHKFQYKIYLFMY